MTSLTLEKWNGPDAITCAHALYDIPYTIFLDSNRPSHPANRYSFIGWNPIERIHCKNGIINHNGNIIEGVTFFDFLKNTLEEKRFDTPNCPFPFNGGLMGYFGYDLARQLENIAENTIDDQNTPDACIGLYTNILAFDHKTNDAWILYQDHQQKEILENRLQNLPEISNAPFTPKWETHKNDSAYCADIEKILEKIHNGDVYQVNLTRRFETKHPKDFNSFAHYVKLREINPAPFSSYMNFDDVQISSCSPERFLNLENGVVETKPIKGTIPDNQNPKIMLNDPKERAENTMIVDLLRNDLSKTCLPHSVKVPKLFDVETFAGLHHLVSTIKGELQDNKTAIDLLKSCFPGGSITGAPKIAATQIIESLEVVRRSIYCGSIGYVGFNGNMDTNIIIRTLVYANNKIYLNAGGGIVSDSIPQKELQETYDKISKIKESFAA